MDEDLDTRPLIGRDLEDPVEFGERDLPGEDHPFESLPMGMEHPFPAGDRALGGGMAREFGNDIACDQGDAGILDEHGICPHRIQVTEVSGYLGKFPVMDQGIDCDIDSDTAHMRIRECLPEFLIIEIRTVFSCPEPFSAEIDGIGTGIDRGHKRVH
jgi:hypothetical protein